LQRAFHSNPASQGARSYPVIDHTYDAVVRFLSRTPRSPLRVLILIVCQVVGAGGAGLRAALGLTEKVRH